MVKALIAVVTFLTEHWYIPVGLLVLAGTIGLGVLVDQAIQKRRVNRYLELAEQFAANGQRACLDAMERLGQRIDFNNQYRTIGEAGIYYTFITEILADGEITEEELARLQGLNGVFSFDAQHAMQLREDAFGAFVSWLGADLTGDEEAGLRAVAEQLEILPVRIDVHLRPIVELRQQRAREAAAHANRVLQAERERQAAQVRLERLKAQQEAAAAVYDGGERTPVTVGVKLRRGESCWFTAPTRLHDRKVFSKGELLLTNKRVLFVGKKAVSVNLSQILDIEADPEADLLRVIKDGRKAPYEFNLAQPLVALAHVERSLGEG